MENHPEIAFYAPLKAPDHPIPSGDRLMARLLMQALARAGFEVHLAGRLSGKDMQGDTKRQARFAALADKMAERLLRHWQKRGYHPDLWFTYHLYYKAPDWLGPRVAERLKIPYVVAEASWAPKRANGPWALNHKAVETALRTASRIFVLNPVDREAVHGLLGAKAPLTDLPPFLDTESLPEKPLPRNQLASSWRLDEHLPWIVTLAMMRPGDKLASYRLLAQAFAGVERDCNLLLIGDGKARSEVEKAFAGDRRVRFLGALQPAAFFPILKQGLFHVWPAINEAFGMAHLEAQWAGLPVVAGDHGGVARVMNDGETGRLLPAGNAAALTAAMNELLEQPEIPRRWKSQCRAYIEAHHSLKAAAQVLSRELKGLV